MRGLRLKLKYEDLIGVEVSDRSYNIKPPKRDAQFLSKLDGKGMRAMQNATRNGE